MSFFSKKRHESKYILQIVCVFLFKLPRNFGPQALTNIFQDAIMEFEDITQDVAQG